MFLSEINKTDQKSIIGLKSGKFRLGQYQIIVTDNDEIEWQAHEGTDKIIGGRCIIESDVLFIGAREYDKGEQNKENSSVNWTDYRSGTIHSPGVRVWFCRPAGRNNKLKGFRTASRSGDILKVFLLQATLCNLPKQQYSNS